MNMNTVCIFFVVYIFLTLFCSGVVCMCVLNVQMLVFPFRLFGAVRYIQEGGGGGVMCNKELFLQNVSKFCVQVQEERARGVGEGGL